MPILDGAGGVGTSTKIVVSNPNQPVFGRINKVVIDVSMPGPKGNKGEKGDPGDVSLSNDNEWTGDQYFVGDHPFTSLAAFATGGSGLTGDPWTGWESAFETERAIRAERGHFLSDGSAIPIEVPLELKGSVGDLLKGSVIRNPDSTDFFSVGAGAAGFTVKGINFQKAGAPPTAGTAIRITPELVSTNGTGTIPVTLEDIGLYNLYDGIVAEGGNRLMLTRVLSGGIVNDGISATGGIDIYLNQVTIPGAGRDCFRFEDVGGIYLNQCTAYAATQRGLRMLGTARHLFAQGLIVDVCVGHNIEIAGTAYQMHFLGCWSAGSEDGHGLLLNQDAGGGGLQWVGGTIRANGLSGARIGGAGEGYSFFGASIGSNGNLATASDRNGVLVEAGRSSWSVMGCRMGSLPGDGPGVQENGVRVLAGASDHYQIRGNVYLDHTSTDVIDGGTGLNKWVEHTEAGAAWVTPSLGAGWVTLAGSQGLRYRKIGNQVVIEGIAQNDSGGALGTTIFTLPVGYRPADGLYHFSLTQTAVVTNSGVVAPITTIADGQSIGVNMSFGAMG